MGRLRSPVGKHLRYHPVIMFSRSADGELLAGFAAKMAGSIRQCFGPTRPVDAAQTE